MSDFAQTVKQQADIVKVIEGTFACARRGRRTTRGYARFTRKNRRRFPSMRCASFTTVSAARLRGRVQLCEQDRERWLPEAVRIVAGKCGIPLPKREFSSPEEAAGARLRAKLLELHETATAWFEEQLRGPEGAVAREYLAVAD